jgi:hypothetical protein
MRRVALAAAGLLLASGIAACSDPAADAKAEADAKAKADAAEATRKVQARADHDAQCLNALRWQGAALGSSGIGKLDTYETYFRDDMEKVLTGKLIDAAPPRPALSTATTFDYLNWSYGENLKVFTAGTDTNGDGKVSRAERGAPGYGIVTACVQEVAEHGKGPWAGPDKVARLTRLRELEQRLKDKGA